MEVGRGSSSPGDEFQLNESSASEAKKDTTPPLPSEMIEEIFSYLKKDYPINEVNKELYERSISQVKQDIQILKDSIIKVTIENLDPKLYSDQIDKLNDFLKEDTVSSLFSKKEILDSQISTIERVAKILGTINSNKLDELNVLQQRIPGLTLLAKSLNSDLSNVSLAWRLMGGLDKALEIANQIPGDFERSISIVDIAKAYLENNQPIKARELYNTIPESFTRARKDLLQKIEAAEQEEKNKQV